MNNLFKDKYFLFSVSIAIIILLSSNFISDDENGIIGIAFDVKQGQNGYTFNLEDTDGKIIRCFTKEIPEENCLYKIKGDYSEDNTILFISSISALNRS
jgi:hypothetical protein